MPGNPAMASSPTPNSPAAKANAFLKKLSTIGAGGKQYFDEVDEVRLSDIQHDLEVGDDKEKLVAMKRLLAMISKGRDVAAAFPNVVKCVINKNPEIRKLVYMFLVHYAEVQPQEALLAINSLQKAMSENNQHMRANALRCMSNIRVKEIAQLIVLAVQKATKDMSPFVRKAAAFAIPKIMRLDPRHLEQCTEIISQLLGDNSTMVVGAAAQAFMEVCPERYDIIHPVFRHICNLIPDVEEWGQVAIVNLLLRYGRNQFVNPDPMVQKALREKRAQQQKDEAPAEKTDDEIFGAAEDDDMVSTIDPDHRLMLQNTLCLMQSRNSAVVLATCVLHFYMAPPAEVSRIAKPMVRLLHANRETEYVALANIATMAATYPRLFSDVVEEFFISGAESLPTRILKLDILTRSANEANITRILKELKEYAKDENKTFVAAAVQAIGRCATALPDVADSCMQQLVQLIVHSSSPTVAAESIVVIKRLLQMNANKDAATAEGQDQERADHRDLSIIKQLARMLIDNSVTIPQARAAIIWLVGEYNEKIRERAPDVLRCLAKTFLDEADIVKLQVLTLGAKLILASDPEPPQPRLLEILRYVLQLAKYDVNYDIRDRARLIRLLIFAEGEGAANTEVRKNAKSLFLTEKPVPAFESVTDLCTGFLLGTLSHVIHDTAPGYRPLEDFPEEAPDPTTRNPPVVASDSSSDSYKDTKMGAFTGLAPGEDPDNYLFGENEGLGEDGDDGWGVGWDDEEEDADAKKKKTPKKSEDDGWGMGDDDWGMGGDDQQGGGDLSWDLEDDGAEPAKKEEGEAQPEADDDGWGIGDEEEKPKEEEEAEKKEEAEEKPEPAEAETKEDAPAPAEEQPAAAGEPEPEPAKEEEAPAAEEAASATVAAVEEGEADE